LHRVRNGIYTDTSDKDEITRTLNNNWMQLACNIFDGPVAVARTAAELRPADGRLYFVSSTLKATRTTQVGHLEFHISPGNTDQGVEPIGLDIKRSTPARYCLENLAPSRGNKNSKKALGSVWVEREIVKHIQRGGQQAANAIRDQAHKLAPVLGLEDEFEKLNAIIAALLSTHPAEGVLQTHLGIANAQGKPFDPYRIDRFRELANYLDRADLSGNAYNYNPSGWRNLTFFESYFSNFIEGTEFTIEEAEEIAFEKKVSYERHKDSHDILAHIEISGDMSEMHQIPQDANDLMDTLKVRHGILFAERPDKRPGQFKSKPNQAGSTHFVLPELVEGTLVQGFDIYKSLPAGLKKSIFIHFMISEVHPFDDGNGRLSRIMMNAELVSQDQHKLILPTVQRESYLNGLKSATRQGRFRTMVKTLHLMQCYTASLDWSAYAEVKATIKENGADKEPDEGTTIFNKVLARLGGQYPAG
jgi:hypothetical protein